MLQAGWIFLHKFRHKKHCHTVTLSRDTRDTSRDGTGVKNAGEVSNQIRKKVKYFGNLQIVDLDGRLWPRKWRKC